MILNGDALTILPTLPAASVDIVVTDPPFAIEFSGTPANYNRNDANVIEGYHEISQSEYPAFTRSWVQEVWRVLKPNGCMYIVSGWSNLNDILTAVKEVGFTIIGRGGPRL